MFFGTLCVLCRPPLWTEYETLSNYFDGQLQWTDILSILVPSYPTKKSLFKFSMSWLSWVYIDINCLNKVQRVLVRLNLLHKMYQVSFTLWSRMKNISINIFLLRNLDCVKDQFIIPVRVVFISECKAYFKTKNFPEYVWFLVLYM